jgi:hypothetical protein
MIECTFSDLQIKVDHIISIYKEITWQRDDIRWIMFAQGCQSNIYLKLHNCDVEFHADKTWVTSFNSKEEALNAITKLI